MNSAHTTAQTEEKPIEKSADAAFRPIGEIARAIVLRIAKKREAKTSA